MTTLKSKHSLSKILEKDMNSQKSCNQSKHCSEYQTLLSEIKALKNELKIEREMCMEMIDENFALKESMRQILKVAISMEDL